MILWSLLPASIAGMIFFGSLRVRGTTQAQREHVSATAREFRLLAGRSLLMLALFGLPLAVVAGVRLVGDRVAFVPMELK